MKLKGWEIIQIPFRDRLKGWKIIKLPFTTRKTYYAHKSGNILSVGSNGKISYLKGKNTNGCKVIDFTNLDTKKKIGITRAQLILSTFIGYRKNMTAHHHNLKCFDDSLKNLSWVKGGTFKVLHALKKNNKKIRLGSYKITPEQAKYLKILSKKMSTKELSERFKISKMQVQRIVRGDCYSNILPELTRSKFKTPGTKLSIVKKIKSELNSNNLKGVQIAKMYGVNESVVSRIKNNKNYKKIR